MIEVSAADRAVLQRLLDGRWHEIRDRAREVEKITAAIRASVKAHRPASADYK